MLSTKIEFILIIILHDEILEVRFGVGIHVGSIYTVCMLGIELCEMGRHHPVFH